MIETLPFLGMPMVNAFTAFTDVIIPTTAGVIYSGRTHTVERHCKGEYTSDNAALLKKYEERGIAA